MHNAHLSPALGGVPHVDHHALAVRAYGCVDEWCADHAYSISRTSLFALVTVWFVWPAQFWYIAYLAPAHLCVALSFVAATPVFAAFPRLLPAVRTRFDIHVVKRSVGSMNYLHNHLPLTVSTALMVSTYCFGPSVQAFGGGWQ
eukprot:6530940-Prymnesium_polylepis.1